VLRRHREAGGLWLERKILPAGPYVLLVLISTGLIVGGLFSRHAPRPIEGGVLTSGRIVEIKEVRYPGGGQPDRFPVIEYSGPGERSHRFVVEFTGIGSVGQTVPVRYDPDDPARAEWVDQPGRWMWKIPVVLGTLGWLGLLGFGWWRWSRRRG